MAIVNIWEPRGVLRRYVGSFSKDDLRKAQDAVYGDARFDSIRYIIGDFINGQPDESVDDFVVELSAAVASTATMTNRNLRIAAVATDPHVLKLLNVFLRTAVSPPSNARIFSTLAEARDWAESRTPT